MINKARIQAVKEFRRYAFILFLSVDNFLTRYFIPIINLILISGTTSNLINEGTLGRSFFLKLR